MADGFLALDAAGNNIEVLTDEVADPDLGITGQKQFVALMDGTVNGSHKAIVDSSGRLKVDAGAGTAVAATLTDGADATQGATTDAQALTGNGSIIALLKAIRALLSDDGSYYVGGVAISVSRSFANVAASQTDSNIVTAVASKKIRVLAALVVDAGTATNITFNSKGAGAGTAISPLIPNGANGGEILPPNPLGWFETNVGEGLTVTTGAGSTTGILVIYVAV